MACNYCLLQVESKLENEKNTYKLARSNYKPNGPWPR